MLHCYLIFETEFVLFFPIDIQTLHYPLLSEIYNGIGHIVDCNYSRFLQFCLYVVQLKRRNSKSLYNGTDVKLSC